jgi:hypothetical protein
MVTLLALYGPDSVFGWLVLLLVANLPLLVVSALVVFVIIRVALAAWPRCRPPSPSAGEFVVPADPEATTSYLLDRARDRRERPGIDSGSGES